VRVKEEACMANIEKIHWFLGVLCILIIIAAGTILGLSSPQTGILLGCIILFVSPFILWWANSKKKHDDDIHYHEREYRRYIKK
jgi:hypothetical protein